MATATAAQPPSPANIQPATPDHPDMRTQASMEPVLETEHIGGYFTHLVVPACGSTSLEEYDYSASEHRECRSAQSRSAAA
jgi:hypothetical protein